MQLYYIAVWVDEMYIDNTLNKLLIICSHVCRLLPSFCYMNCKYSYHMTRYIYRHVQDLANPGPAAMVGHMPVFCSIALHGYKLGGIFELCTAKWVVMNLPVTRSAS